ncbi:Uncharacterised protein [Vibrio cholerae]|nr:Uncharacterised protein [Vibrio cholerae]
MRLNSNVECGGRFIGNQQFRATQQSHRNHHTLTHTARKLVRIHGDTLTRFWDLYRFQHAY